MLINLTKSHDIKYFVFDLNSHKCVLSQQNMVMINMFSLKLWRERWKVACIYLGLWHIHLLFIYSSEYLQWWTNLNHFMYYFLLYNTLFFFKMWNLLGKFWADLGIKKLIKKNSSPFPHMKNLFFKWMKRSVLLKLQLDKRLKTVAASFSDDACIETKSTLDSPSFN